MATHKASQQAKNAYNARRREYRAAQRYLKRASESSGALAEKNRALAQIHFQNALETYDVNAPAQKISSQMINLAAQFGIDIQGDRSRLLTGDEATVKRAIKRSETALESSMKDVSKRTEYEAQALIANKQIGKRIMGGLVDVWSGKVKKGASAIENRQAAQEAIFDYFNANSWVEVLQKLEQEIGTDLFAISNELEMYDIVRIAIQKKVTGNTLVV